MYQLLDKFDKKNINKFCTTLRAELNNENAVGQ